MNKNKSLKSLSLLSLLFIYLWTSCNDSPTENEFKYPPDNQHKITISQGVWGNVWFLEGNFMPTTDNSSNGKITAVEREIYIYEATRFDSVLRDSIRHLFIEEINSNYVDEVASDKDGFFQIVLPPGRYSFFVKEDSLYFANESDGDGYLMSAQVNSNTIVKRQINIDYKAVY